VNCQPHQCTALEHLRAAKGVSRNFIQVSPDPNSKEHLKFMETLELECLSGYQNSENSFTKQCSCSASADNSKGVLVENPNSNHGSSAETDQQDACSKLETGDTSSICAEENLNFCPAVDVAAATADSTVSQEESFIVEATVPSGKYQQETTLSCKPGYVFASTSDDALTSDSSQRNKKRGSWGIRNKSKTVALSDKKQLICGGPSMPYESKIRHSGSWFPEISTLKCEKNPDFCPELKPIPNGQVLSLTDEKKLHSVATLKCDNGYEVASIGGVETTAVCNSQAVWERLETFSCSRIANYCLAGEALQSLENGNLKTLEKNKLLVLPINEQLKQINRADYCAPGYSFPGEEMPVCKEGDEKSGKLDPLPFCT
ncbi:unnamed protein product, partial [Amoebophrya sp. A120]